MCFILQEAELIALMSLVFAVTRRMSLLNVPIHLLVENAFNFSNLQVLNKVPISYLSLFTENTFLSLSFLDIVIFRDSNADTQMFWNTHRCLQGVTLMCVDNKCNEVLAATLGAII